MLGKGTEGFGNKRTSGDHPNYNIIKIGQNTEKSPRELRRLAVTQTPLENHQIMLLWINRCSKLAQKEYKIIHDWVIHLPRPCILDRSLILSMRQSGLFSDWLVFKLTWSSLIRLPIAAPLWQNSGSHCFSPSQWVAAADNLVDGFPVQRLYGLSFWLSYHLCSCPLVVVFHTTNDKINDDVPW